jgi:hypothetical protein
MKAIVLTLLAVLLYTMTAFAGSAGFKDNGNGTVTDITTNLMWQQCSYGLSGAGCATGTAAAVTWDNAISYCESLSFGGFIDWRLPTIKDLLFIYDMTLITAPTIDATYFPNTQSSYYWSSTTYAPATPYAWEVNFGSGGTTFGGKAGMGYVRCVRGGQ